MAKGRFPEGGDVDRLDKSLSRTIFHISLPWVAEMMLTVPGCWFGCPPFAIGVVPVLLAAAPSQTTAYSSGVAGLIVILTLGPKTGETGEHHLGDFWFFS